MSYGLPATMELPLVAIRHEETDPARLRVLGHVRTDVRRNDEDPGDLTALVPYLVASGGPSGERHNVSFAKVPIAIVQANGRFAAEHNDEFLASVVVVVDELRAAGL